MFFRNESFRDFIRLYPIISGILAINLNMWLLMYFPIQLGTNLDLGCWLEYRD